MVGSAGQWPLAAQGFSVPQRVLALPPVREFVMSPGFGGAAAVVAAVLVAAVALWAARRASIRHRLELDQRERQHQQRGDDERHAAAVARCWQRLVWVVETAGVEPVASEGATLGLGPELALELLRGLLRDAEQLGDDTLAKAVAVYLGQFSLVLAQQGSLLSELAEASSAATGRGIDEHAETDDAPPGRESGVEPPRSPKRVATGGRRQRK